MQKMVTLDAFDRKLIALVRQDNQTPARILADRVGLSVSAVLRRLRRLREDKIIVADIAVLDPALTGSALTMHVLVRMTRSGPREMEAFARAITRHPEVTGAWEVTGEDDFMLKVQVGTMEEYHLLTHRAFGESNGVQQFKTFITIRTVMDDDASSRPLQV